MNYKNINIRNRNKMIGICNNEIEMNWEDNNFMDYLLGLLPKVYRINDDNNISKEISELEKILRDYDFFSTEKKQFINNIEKSVEKIKLSNQYWYGLNPNHVKNIIDIHKFCLISGEGGIGKSYFIKCLEEKLEKRSVEHLCIYGKFEKTIEDIDVEEISTIANNKTFVFIIDAINEMPLKTQIDLISILENLKDIKGMRFVLTYRTGTVSQDILLRLQEIAEYSYIFPGISYESALEQLSVIPVADVYRYEDILYSNNPMLIKMLCNVLQKELVVEQKEKSVATITYILEQYIKIGLDDKTLWTNTKKIASWLYDNNKKYIDETSLFKLVDKPIKYIEKMEQQGFIVRSINDKEAYYSFSIDTLTDFLIARNLLNNLNEKEYEKTVELINEKLNKFYGLHEAVILILFDKFTPNYELIKKILLDTGLIDYFDYDVLLKVKFADDNLKVFLEYFTPTNKSRMLLYFGGYIDKPFNCVNYINEYFFSNIDEQCKELSKILSGGFIEGRVKERLKNILYFINIRDFDNKRAEEALYFSLWCCAAANTDVRHLAMKLLFDVITHRPQYKKLLIDKYNLIDDDYIKEAIIYVICSSSNLTVNDIYFLNDRAHDENFLHAKSLKRIAAALGQDFNYINWNKDNKYIYIKDAEISKDLDRLLFHIDLHEKYLLHFRYFSYNRIENYRKFLNVNKFEISKWNSFLQDTFSCVKNGECNGTLGFEDKVEQYFKITYKDNYLDDISFICSFEPLIKEIFEKYGVLYKYEDRIKNAEREFENSVFRKAIIIAQDFFYGSIMCNYYTNQFATFNNIQNSIGYEVFNPIAYEEEIRLTTPIPIYQNKIEKIGDIIINKLNYPKNSFEEDLSQWVRNAQITEENLKCLITPVEKFKKEWIILAARIFLHEGESGKHLWQEHYDYWCCTSDLPEIDGTENDRYLTIELKEYKGNLEQYINCCEYPYLCKDMPSIMSNTDIFDENYLVLPPADIIRTLNLKVSLIDMTWRNENNEIIIYCNNNKHSYYKDFIGGTVIMRKDIYDEYIKTNNVKFFAFSEKWTPQTGYLDETAFHFEIVDGKIFRKFYNYIANNTKKNEPELYNCDNCIYEFNNKDHSENAFFKFLVDYGTHEDIHKDYYEL